MDGEFPSLLGAMRSGEIRCLKGQTNRMQLGDVLLDRESVRRWREKRRVQRDEYLSIDMAARVLGVKQEVAYPLSGARRLLARRQRRAARLCEFRSWTFRTSGRNIFRSSSLLVFGSTRQRRRLDPCA